MTKKINHWECSVCDKEITYKYHDNEIWHKTHFDISRSRKDLHIMGEEIEELNRNEKMLHYLCEDCFTKVLNESPTLGKLFYCKSRVRFIY